MSRPELNDEQRPAVLEHGRDLLLSAGAGSGKTRVLVDRYLRILEDGEWNPALPARLLAITFTEKAAQEMRDRIYREVSKRAARSEPREAARLAELARELESAPISTIHGFCSRLLRENAAEAGLDPRFRVPDSVELRELEDAVLARLLAEDDADLLLLAGEFGLSGLQLGLAEHRDLRRSLGLVGESGEEPEARIARHEEAVLDQLHSRWVPWLAELPGRLDGLCAHLPGGVHPSATQTAKIEEARALLAAAPPGDLDATLPTRLMEAMKGFRTRGKNIPDEGLLGEKWDALKDELKLAERGWAPLASGESPRPRGLRAAFLRLQAEVDRRLIRGMRERSWLDFEDLQLAALALLEGDRSLRERLQAQYTQVLVDEMQDTNRLQLRLIRQLAPEASNEGRALFLVGDPRQSIYSFRNADVDVFRRETDLARSLGRHRSLSFNYRSHPDLLNFFNAFFPEDDFPPMRSPRDSDGEMRVRIQLTVTGARRTQAARHEAAEALATLLRDAHDAGLAVREGEGERALDWKDVTILVRSGNAIGPIARALSARDIPHEAAGGKEYFIRQELLDLENLIAALDDPYHRFKLARGLRGEAIGLGRRDLANLMLSDKSECTVQREGVRLVERLAAAASGELGLSEDGRRRARAFLDLRRKIGHRLHRLSMQELVMEVVRASGFDLRAATERNGLKMLRNLRQLSELLGELERHRRMTVAEFLEHMRRIREISPKRQEAWVPEEGESLVKILTIHAAKGLEFPFVVVADLERDLSSVRRPDDLASLRLDIGDEQDAALGLCWRGGDGDRYPDILHEWIRETAEAREAEESRRLFYVAVTRAKDYLLLSGVVKDKDGEAAAEKFETPPSKPGATFLGELRRGLQGMDPSLYRLCWTHEASAGPMGQLLGRRDEPRSAESAPADWSPLSAKIAAPGELELPVTSLSLLHACPLRWTLERRYGLRGAAAEKGEPFHSVEGVEDGMPGGASFGTDLHRILERWNFRSPPEDAFNAACSADLDERRRAAARETLLGFFVADNIWTRSRLPEGEDFRREESFVLRLGELSITGQIDLHFLWEGRRFLVDWKSDRVDEATISGRIHHHRLQMSLYALALREAGLTAPRAFIAFLRAGEFREVEVDERKLKRAENLAANLARKALDLSSRHAAAGLADLPLPNEPPCSGCPWKDAPCTDAYRRGGDSA